MKKLFLILFLVSLSTGYAQVKVDGSFPLSIGFSDTITVGGGRVDTLVNNASGSNGLFKRKISGTAVLTDLSDTVKNYWSVSIVSDDTLEVSTIGSFPTIETIVILPDVPLTLGPYNIVKGDTKSKKNFYIRGRNFTSGAGTARYYLYLYGW